MEDGEYLKSIGAAEAPVAEAYEYINSIPVDRETELALYCIEEAIKDADPFDYGDEALERRLLDCYEDSCDLGIFAADADAAAAAEALQMVDDAKAEELGREALGEDFGLSGGPVYRDHVAKWAAEGLESVEI